jgi:hypothetical protein
MRDSSRLSIGLAMSTIQTSTISADADEQFRRAPNTIRTTAPPRRREVTNPARMGPAFSVARTLRTNSLPRREIPPDLTRSNSDRCVSRRYFGNEKEVAADIRRVSLPGRTTEVFSRTLGRRLRKKKLRRTYELGAVAVGDSAAAGGLVAAGVAAGSVVSVFCSHAARSAAPARIQMHFFIVLIEGTLVQSKNRSKAVFPGWKLCCV